MENTKVITIIVGKPGKGKTVFTANIIANKILNSRSDYINLKREIKYLKQGGFNYLELPPQKHLIYTDFKFRINRKIESYYIDGYKLGLPNPYFETTFIPPYSTIFLDEAQRYYDSRNTKSLRTEVYNWFQLHRQNHYNIYLVCQRVENIDINIRALADSIIVIDDLKLKTNEFGAVEHFKWITREFESPDTAEEYCRKKDREEVSILGKKVIIESHLPLFRYYDSFGNKPVFFNGKENSPFDYYIERKYNYSVESFVEYNENHYFTAPKGYWKSADYDKKVNKKMEVNT